MNRSNLELSLKKMWLSFIFFQIVSLIIIMSIVEISIYRNKLILAKTIVDGITNPLVIKDFRRITELISSSTQDEFAVVSVIDISGKNDLIFKGDISSLPSASFNLPIVFDLKSQVPIGNANFKYKLFSQSKSIILAWSIILVTTIAIIMRFRKELIKIHRRELDLASSVRINEIARQVAHDIRSPLSALNSIIANVNDINDDYRSLIQQVTIRIQDISNDLLRLSDPKLNNTPTSQSDQSSFEIRSTIKGIVDEKNYEFSAREVKIDLRLPEHPLAILANGNKADIERVISNIINNAYEASTNGQVVFVNVVAKDQIVGIEIVDSGSGISEDILKRLTLEPISFGKEFSKSSGSGIGLYSAHKTLTKYCGSLDIQSKIGIGTRVLVNLKRA